MKLEVDESIALSIFELHIQAKEEYAREVADDLRKRIIQEAFDDPYDIRRYANSIRNVEIITP